MSYKILPQQKTAARKLGVTIKPSTAKGKKIDVYKNGEKVASIGAMGYGDYWTYYQSDRYLARSKRESYKARHAGEQNKIGSPGYYAWYILW
ncbi:MAG: hypothetical protein EBR30_14110 [Cytophagia bacterium]|jgi:hypothetical protein|nr:hypothetical protein [Cytophagia bacterium]